MLFSMFDIKAGVFGALIALENAEVARRMFVTSILSGQESLVTKFPDDYILYEMGGFDNSTGNFSIHPSPIKVMTGFEAVESAKVYLKEKERRDFDVIGQQITDDIKDTDCVGQSN